MAPAKHLFIFGFGYSAAALAQHLQQSGEAWQISATSRHRPRRLEMQRLGIHAYDFPDEGIPAALAQATHILSSIAPNRLGDPALEHYREAVAGSSAEWVGYLSTTGVYGDHQGNWVDETTPPKPQNERQEKRLKAEREWRNAHPQTHIFRLAGIYGPGRGIVRKLKAGMAQQVVKEGQYFSRIQVHDIARALYASMLQPQPHSVYNLADDMPAPAHDVTAFAAEILGLPMPPLIDWQQAEMSEMAREFYSANRRVKAERIKVLLPDNNWRYPSYREGISAELE